MGGGEGVYKISLGRANALPARKFKSKKFKSFGGQNCITSEIFQYFYGSRIVRLVMC